MIFWFVTNGLFLVEFLVLCYDSDEGLFCSVQFCSVQHYIVQTRLYIPYTPSQYTLPTLDTRSKHKCHPIVSFGFFQSFATFLMLHAIHHRHNTPTTQTSQCPHDTNNSHRASTTQNNPKQTVCFFRLQHTPFAHSTLDAHCSFIAFNFQTLFTTCNTHSQHSKEWNTQGTTRQSKHRTLSGHKTIKNTPNTHNTLPTLFITFITRRPTTTTKNVHHQVNNWQEATQLWHCNSREQRDSPLSMLTVDSAPHGSSRTDMVQPARSLQSHDGWSATTNNKQQQGIHSRQQSQTLSDLFRLVLTHLSTNQAINNADLT